MELNSQTLPVFILENEIKFIINRSETHRHILTIYNPYEFALRFKGTKNLELHYIFFSIIECSE